jgi:mono/diheme cytochrome c family protein
LPVGFLLAALLLQALSAKEKHSQLRSAIPVILLTGAVSAVLSCITGWLLASGGDYDDSLVSWHRWMGISLAILSLIIYFRLRKRGFDRLHNILLLVLLILIIITGHLGGSLTHGSDYLTGPLTGKSSSGLPLAADTPLANVQEARAYVEVIRPILQNNCYSCHGPTRQKGGLQMDAPDLLMKGGKDGAVILPGNGNGSELIKRLFLPADDEHHMPPKDKRPLHEKQLALIHWWIDQGADFTRRVKELQQPDSIRPALLSLQQKRRSRLSPSDMPAAQVEAADPKAIDTLMARGVLVLPLAQNSNWLEADFSFLPPAPDSSSPSPSPLSPSSSSSSSSVPSCSSLLPLLLSLRQQLVSLRLTNTDIGDSALATISSCRAIRVLDLSGTRITDKGLPVLRSLDSLRVLNLVGTGVTADGVLALRPLKKLRAIYLFNTGIATKDWSRLQKAFPLTLLDSGNYSIPFLATDTEVVKPPKASPK